MGKATGKSLDEVVEECKGLPKAIVTVGKATGKSLDEVVEDCKGLPKAIVTVGKAIGKSLDEVVEECKGLPKAIVTVGKATGKSLDDCKDALQQLTLQRLLRRVKTPEISIKNLGKNVISTIKMTVERCR